MVSAIEVLPVRSISTVSSAFMSSRQERATALISSPCGALAPEGGGSGEKSASRGDKWFSAKPSSSGANAAPRVVNIVLPAAGFQWVSLGQLGFSTGRPGEASLLL